jgi:hypothetical protein
LRFGDTIDRLQIYNRHTRYTVQYTGWIYSIQAGDAVYRLEIQYTGWRYSIQAVDTVDRLEIQ